MEKVIYLLIRVFRVLLLVVAPANFIICFAIISEAMKNKDYGNVVFGLLYAVLTIVLIIAYYEKPEKSIKK